MRFDYKWAIGYIFIWFLLALAFFFNIEPALNVLLFIYWFVFIVFICFILFPSYEEIKNQIKISSEKNKKYIFMNRLQASCAIILLIINGYLFTAGALLFMDVVLYAIQKDASVDEIKEKNEQQI